MYESLKHPLLSAGLFRRRMVRHGAFAFGVLLGGIDFDPPLSETKQAAVALGEATSFAAASIASAAPLRID